MRGRRGNTFHSEEVPNESDDKHYEAERVNKDAEKVAELLIDQNKDNFYQLHLNLGTFNKQNIRGKFKGLRKLMVKGLGNDTNYYVLIKSMNEKQKIVKTYKYYPLSDKTPFIYNDHSNEMQILLLPTSNDSDEKYRTYHDPDRKFKTLESYQAHLRQKINYCEQVKEYKQNW